jgi:hypothetical protein
MIRTRDFLLFLISVGFLIVMITAETARQFFGNRGEDIPVVATPTFSDGALPDFSAEVAVRAGVDRQGNIERLREQLASFLALPPTETILLAPPTAEAPIATSTTTEEEIPIALSVALLCGGYTSYVGPWPNESMTIEEQEGMRVISVKNDEGAGGEEIVAALPIRTLGTPISPSCLPNDVVAVSKSGGLIRNNEASSYLAFPEHVLVGYTIDGFPLYGFTTQETDYCGGMTVDDEYRYYLSASRETILNCFVAPPASLPS